MTLSTFITKTLLDLDNLEGGVVHFDVAVYPDGNYGIHVDRSGTQGLSRIKFDVKIENKSGIEVQDKEDQLTPRG